jgi:hypothetical protein
MSESTGIDYWDYEQLRIGTALALSHGRTLALEATVLRIVRIVLLVIVPTVAVSALVTACSDDTTNQTVQDMSGTVHDMAMPVVVHDMANPHD